jgi:hypothetical protein
MLKGSHYSAEERLAIRLRCLKKSMPPEEFARFTASDGTLKWCPACRQLKPVGEFYKSKQTFDGLLGHCKVCNDALSSAGHRRRMADPEYAARRRQSRVNWWAAAKADGRSRGLAKQYHLKRYQLTPDGFIAMLAAQRHRCAICECLLTGARDTHVDHDHACCPDEGRSCGKCVRGLLCTDCNTGLAKFRDDPAILRRAASYLENVASLADNLMDAETVHFPGKGTVRDD